MRLVPQLLLAVVLEVALAIPRWEDRGLPPEKRAEALLEEMTLQEKLDMLHGYGFGWKDDYVGKVIANKRLRIPGRCITFSIGDW